MRRSAHRARLALVLALGFLPLAMSPVGAAPQRWLHVAVDGDDDETVRIHLPLTIVEGKVRSLTSLAGIGEGLGIPSDSEVSRFRSLWRALRDQEGDFVTINSKDEHLRITKDGGHLLVHVTGREGDENIEIRIPVAVLDALFPEDGPPDLGAALAALADAGDAEVVRIRGKDGLVRVWVDTKPEGGESAAPDRRQR